MKKCLSILVIAATMLVSRSVHAQCTGPLTLTTQLEVDNFNCTSFTGDLTISGIGITDLAGLSELQSIGGTLKIDNTHLISVTGLSNLEHVRSLTITNNSLLLNINGLSGLHDVDPNSIDAILGINSNLDIENNPVLANINGLIHLTIIEHDITIKNNHNLGDIDGLSNLTFCGRMTIDNDPALHDIDGLGNLRLPSEVVIQNNPVLENIDGLSKVEQANYLTIENNSSLQNLDGLNSLTWIGFTMIIRHNPLITNLDGLSHLGIIRVSMHVEFNSHLTDFCGLYNMFSTGVIGVTIFGSNGDIDILNNGDNSVHIAAPQDITVNADAGSCTATITAAQIGVATTPNSCIVPITITHNPSPFQPSMVFSVGTTNIKWTATDAAGNTATAMQTITVVDDQPPTISCPGDVTVSCVSDMPAVNISSVTASDNCSTAVVTHISDDTTNKTCANKFTLTRNYRATDGSGNTADCSQTIIVNDDTPPQITGLSVSQQVLAPPNHKMVDVTVNYTVSDNCVSNPTYAINVSSNEPINGTGDGDTSPDWLIVDDHHIKLRAERAANGSGRIYTITISANDGCNGQTTATIDVHVAHNITSPQSGRPFIVGSNVNFSGDFWDKPGNKHTAKWLIDGSTSVKGTVIEPATNKNGKITGSYKFNNPGVYKLQMNVTDQIGVTSYANTNGDLEEIVVVYDPNGGYTYGGGYFNSQAGALVSDPSAEGKASYGFTVNYFKSSTYPKGETQFEFKVGNFEFNALNFDYLVINGARAQFRGTGKITGDQSGYGFIMTVIDGALDGSDIDKIRMKIYNKTNGRVIYDNQPGANDAADPVEPVAENSSLVIYSTNNLVTKVESERAELPMQLMVKAIPNPSNGNFAITVASQDLLTPINIQVVDIQGRLIEERKIAANSILRIGDKFSSGVYVLTVNQGKNRQQIKLVKTSGWIY